MTLPISANVLAFLRIFRYPMYKVPKLSKLFEMRNIFNPHLGKIPQIMHEMRLILLFTQPLHSKKSTQKQTETKTVARLRFSKIFPNRIAVFIRNVGPPSSTFHVPALEANWNRAAKPGSGRRLRRRLRLRSADDAADQRWRFGFFSDF